MNIPGAASWFNSTEGTVVCEATAPAFTGLEQVPYAIVGSNPNNDFIMMYRSTTGGSFQGRATSQALLNSGALANSATVKTAFAFKANDFAVSRAGGAVAVDTVGTLVTGLNFRIGQWGAFGVWWDSTVKTISYYPKRLSNADLVRLSA
jgi:hypothetical protein